MEKSRKPTVEQLLCGMNGGHKWDRTNKNWWKCDLCGKKRRKR